MFRIDRANPKWTGQAGVTIHDPARCWAGFTLYYSRQSEHAQLIDMTGEIVHRWEYAQGDIYWHFAEMLPNGHLLVIPNSRNGQMLLELDWDSQPVWKHPARAHHDAQRLANGNTLCVCHGQAHYRELDERPLLYDYLQEITPDHKVTWEWHYGSHHLQICDMLGQDTPILDSFWDWPHINTVEALPDTPLGQRDARFRAGNVLISGRGAHTIAIIDKRYGEMSIGKISSVSPFWGGTEQNPPQASKAARDEPGTELWPGW